MLNFSNRGIGIAALLTLLGGCSPPANQSSGHEASSEGSGSGGPLPCAIEQLVKARCQMCHGPMPIGGAPMSLVTATDFQRDYTARTTEPVLGKSGKLYELARIRINGAMGTPKMPQGNPLSPADFQLLDSWLAAGAPSGQACDGTGAGGGGSGASGSTGTSGWTGTSGSTGTSGFTGAGGSAGSAGWNGAGSTVGVGGDTGGGAVTGAGGSAPLGEQTITPDSTDQCANDPTQFQPLVARPGETCYEFQTHGVSSPTDTSKFTIQPGESYNQFYFNVPWPAGSVATRFGARFDNLQVLHHWLGFSSSANVAAGTVETSVTGTTLGENAELLGGWAVGGCNVEFPDDMGLKLPDSGKIMVQWHHFNSTGAPAQDGTAVQFCVVPASTRKNIGGLTFLGTENFNGLLGMPAGQTSNFSGTCTNDSGSPITIVGWNPHMHLLGVNMKSVVTRATGETVTAFDHPFLFDHQVNYMIPNGFILNPGDKITSTCTFDNTTTANVAFGQSTHAEMCYQFTFSYPYGALNNGVISLIGAKNTCW